MRRVMEKPPSYLPCDACGGDGCCVCEYFGVLHRDHPLFGAVLIDDEETEQGTA